jgi:hypothetical protein
MKQIILRSLFFFLLPTIVFAQKKKETSKQKEKSYSGHLIILFSALFIICANEKLAD